MSETTVTVAEPSATEAVSEVLPEHASEAAVEIASVQAEADVAQAAIAAEAAVEIAATQTANDDLRRELEECRNMMMEQSRRLTEQAEQISSIQASLSSTRITEVAEEQPPAEESVEATQESPVVQEEQAPPKRKPHHRLI